MDDAVDGETAVRITEAAASRVLRAAAGVRADAVDAAADALAALGAGPGRAVVVPEVEGRTAALAAAVLGAPVDVVRVDPRSRLPTAAALRAAVGPTTAAVVLVPVGGALPPLTALEGIPLVVGQRGLAVPPADLGASAGWVELPAGDRTVSCALAVRGALRRMRRDGAPSADLAVAAAEHLASLWRLTGAASVARSRFVAGLRGTDVRVLPAAASLVSGDVALVVDPLVVDGGAIGLAERLAEAGVPARLLAATDPLRPTALPDVVLVDGWVGRSPERIDELADAVRDTVRAAVTASGRRPDRREATGRGPRLVALVGVGPAVAAVAAAATSDPELALTHAARAAAIGGDVDAAVLVGRPAQNAQLAIDCIRHQRPVVTALPVAGDPGDARLVLELARRADVPVVPLTPWRFDADVQRARSIAQAGALGTVRRVRVVVGPHVAGAARVPGTDGVLAELLPAAGDLVRFLVGPIRRVLSVETVPATTVDGRWLPLGDGPGRAVVHALVDDGISAELVVGWGVDGGEPDLLTVHGDEATVTVGRHGTAVRQHEGSVLQVGDGYRAVEALTAALRHAVDVAGEPAGAARAAAGAELRSAIELVEAAQRSARRAAWEDVRGVPVIDLRSPSGVTAVPSVAGG